MFHQANMDNIYKIGVCQIIHIGKITFLHRKTKPRRNIRKQQKKQKIYVPVLLETAFGVANLELKPDLVKPIKKIPLYSKLEKGEYETAGS